MLLRIALLAIVVIPQISPAEESAQADFNWYDEVELIDELASEGRFEEALTQASRSLEMARAANNPEWISQTYRDSAIVHFRLQNFEQAQADIEVGIAIARQSGLERTEADLLSVAGVLDMRAGSLDRAKARFLEALKLHDALGSRESCVSSLNNLGLVHFEAKEFEAAIEYYRRALDQLGDIQNWRLEASILSNIAEIYIHTSQLQEAEQYLMKSLPIELQLNDPLYLAYSYFNFGELRAKQQRLGAANDFYNNALALQDSLNQIWAASLTRLRMAELQFQQGNLPEALQIMQSGFEQAKQINARTLLRDYSTLFGRVHRELRDNPLADYYTQLASWLTDEIEEPLRTAALVAKRPPEASLPNPQVAAPSDLESVLRKTAIAMLVVLILLLGAEILRLRKIK